MNIVFMGTPDFAVEALKSLCNSKHTISAVFTQTDKPKGRGYRLTPPPVKVFAEENNIAVFQPKSLRNDESFNQLKNSNPDLIVVAAYGKILPKNIIELPKYGCINIHASLLPKYRGAAPIQWSIINGEKLTGVTTMYMDEGLDTGDMLLKAEVTIDIDMTYGELYENLSHLGASLIIKTIEKLEDGTLTRIKQDDNEMTYAPLIKNSMAVIDWNKNAIQIHNLVRGVNPTPMARTKWNGKLLKIITTEFRTDYKCEAGKVVSLNPLTIGCANDTALIINRLQLEGKRQMTSEEFLRGNRLSVGEFLGE